MPFLEGDCLTDSCESNSIDSIGMHRQIYMQCLSVASNCRFASRINDWGCHPHPCFYCYCLGLNSTQAASQVLLFVCSGYFKLNPTQWQPWHSPTFHCHNVSIGYLGAMLIPSTDISFGAVALVCERFKMGCGLVLRGKHCIKKVQKPVFTMWKTSGCRLKMIEINIRLITIYLYIYKYDQIPQPVVGSHLDGPLEVLHKPKKNIFAVQVLFFNITLLDCWSSYSWQDMILEYLRSGILGHICIEGCKCINDTTLL